MRDVLFHVDKTNFGSMMIKVSGNAHWQVPCHAPTNEMGGTAPLCPRVTIATLPEGPLLDIFSFYVEDVYEYCDLDEVFGIKLLEAWCTLVHVCQGWRNLVFASPRRLNVRLVCTNGTPVREMLNIWPTLPIVVQTQFHARSQWEDSKYTDNIIAALEHGDRVCQIGLRNLPFHHLPLFTEILEESFPALTRLHIDTQYQFPMLHPDSFLGGSAPSLRSLTLTGVPFPELPKLLLSTKDLVELCLSNVPHSGYISPEAMVTCLSSLTSLEKFCLAFASPESRLDGSSRRLPSLARVDLPNLAHVELRGVNDYVEDLVARINVPLLTYIMISFFDDPPFVISQFDQLIGRVENFKVLHQARVKLDGRGARALFGLSADPTDGTTLGFSISCTEFEWDFSSLETLSNLSASPFRLSSFERLDLWNGYAPPEYWDAVMQKTQWLGFFQPFTAVKDLYLEDELAIPIARSLRQLTGKRATEVLPALRNIFLKRGIVYHEEDPEVFPGKLPLEVVLQVIGPFIAARRLSGCPVAVQFLN